MGVKSFHKIFFSAQEYWYYNRIISPRTAEMELSSVVSLDAACDNASFFFLRPGVWYSLNRVRTSYGWWVVCKAAVGSQWIAGHRYLLVRWAGRLPYFFVGWLDNWPHTSYFICVALSDGRPHAYSCWSDRAGCNTYTWCSCWYIRWTTCHIYIRICLAYLLAKYWLYYSTMDNLPYIDFFGFARRLFFFSLSMYWTTCQKQLFIYWTALPLHVIVIYRFIVLVGCTIGQYKRLATARSLMGSAKRYKEEDRLGYPTMVVVYVAYINTAVVLALIL